MKNNFVLSTAMFLFLAYSTPPMAYAEDLDDQVATMEKESDNNQSVWTQRLKDKYNLTDVQIQELQKKGLSKPQIAMASELALKSGKTLDEVVAMRTESKMGWGRIAKDLGVHPRTIGQSVSSLRRGDDRIERTKEKQEKQRARLELKKERSQGKKEFHQNKGQGRGKS